MRHYKDKLIFIAFVALVAIVADQFVFIAKIEDTNLSYSRFTTQKAKQTGFIEPECRAAAYRLTWFSSWKLRRNSETSIFAERWSEEKRSLKIPTWGCGLAAYDHGGQGLRLTKMYKWGEGLHHDTLVVWHNFSDEHIVKAILPDHNRYLHVIGANAI